MLNPALDRIIRYASKEIARAADGRDVVNLAIGEPDFGPPPYLAERLGAILPADAVLASLKRYEQARGDGRLRAAIAAYYRTLYGAGPDPEREVLVTHGGAGALALALLVGTAPGDRVLIPDPSYMLYERLARLLGREPVRVPRRRTDGLAYDLDALRPALRGAAALIVNSPENPTGYVCPPAELEALAAACGEAGAWLIHDEVYDQLAFDATHLPARATAAGLPHAILVNSLSKKFGVPGLRVGWLVGDAALVDAAAKAHDYVFLAVHRQAEAIATALLDDPGLAGWLAQVRALMAGRLARLRAGLAAIPGFELPFVPRGGLFLFPQVGALAQRLGAAAGGSTAGERVQAHLLRAAGVATVAGGVYGASVDDCLRMVAAVDPAALDEALARIAAACGAG